MSYLPLAPAAIAGGDRVVLPEGRVLRIRPLAAEDRDGLEALYGRLSGESRRRRFLGPKPEVSRKEIAYLSAVDGVRHGALAAVDEATGELVAEARFAAWAGRESAADVAVTVADEVQGRRVGTALIARVVERACAGGFARLTASTLLDNVASRAMLVRAGFRPRTASGGVLDLELELGGCA